MDELLSARIDPRSFWLSFMYQQHGHVGVFRFIRRNKGECYVCINSAEDMRTALDKLLLALGDRVEVNVKRDERKKRFVPR
jgi:hypothetical protein